jgi:hypothetical protein
MSVRCNFQPDGKFMVCKCGMRIPITDPQLPPERYFARCKDAPPPPNTRRCLGVFVAKQFARLGITKQRYRRFRYWLGLEATCGCGERERQLDEWGWWIGHQVWRLLRLALNRKPPTG